MRILFFFTKTIKHKNDKPLFIQYKSNHFILIILNRLTIIKFN